MVLPLSSALDVSYVGTHNYNSVFVRFHLGPAQQRPMDLNAPEIGAAYLSQYQMRRRRRAQSRRASRSDRPDASLPRPRRYHSTRPIFYTQYDSLQTSSTAGSAMGGRAA